MLIWRIGGYGIQLQMCRVDDARIHKGETQDIEYTNECMKNQQIDDITQNYSISRVFASFPTQTFSIYRRLPFAAPIFPSHFNPHSFFFIASTTNLATCPTRRPPPRSPRTRKASQSRFSLFLPLPLLRRRRNPRGRRRLQS